ncbi:MAG TPA: MBL fold metallo-hydrolase [Promineifilum sp.]|nr:MBL fold metallo-hydrolase [Promineifilum sp.]
MPTPESPTPESPTPEAGLGAPSWADVLWIDAGSVNCYLCHDPDGFTLIDAATPGKADVIFDRLAEFGGRPSDLKRIFITHADLDHAGSAAAVQQRSGATVYASAATAALLVEGRSPKHMPRLVQFIVDRFVRYGAVDRAAIRPVADGDELPILGRSRVLAAPGHTPDQYTLHCPAAGIVFAADALNTRDNRLQLSPPRMTADPSATKRTAARLLGLAPRVVACGHGAPLVDDAAAVDALLAQLGGSEVGSSL